MHVPALKVTGGLKKVEVSPINPIQHIPAFLWADIGRCACQGEKKRGRTEADWLELFWLLQQQEWCQASCSALFPLHNIADLIWQMDKKPGGACTNQNPVVRAWGERCKAVQRGEQVWAHVIVFAYVSALGPRAAVHSRPALLPKCGLTPSLVLALPLMPKSLYASC